jgi:hypothetical protein
MNTDIDLMIAILSPRAKWCKGAYGKESNGSETLNFSKADRLCLVGALSHLFTGDRLRKNKKFLEKFLEINAQRFLRDDVFHPPKNVTARMDYWNLAKFNDESDYPTVMRFLYEAREADMEAVLDVQILHPKFMQAALIG